MAPQLTCRGLTRRYRRGFMLGPVDVGIPVGVTCLVGPNGAGKSTLFRLLVGVDSPTSGGIDANGGRFGYLPQSPQLPGNATARQFLRHVAWLHGVARHEREPAVERALHQVNLGDKADGRIKHLSGGMARRLGIAHALVHDPELLLLDEPTVGLDPRQRLSVREAIRSLSRDHVVLVSTHLVEDVRGLADRVLVLEGGRIAFDGTVDDLEDRADVGAPGETRLERALTTVMGVER